MNATQLKVVKNIIKNDNENDNKNEDNNNENHGVFDLLKGSKKPPNFNDTAEDKKKITEILEKNNVKFPEAKMTAAFIRNLNKFLKHEKNVAGSINSLKGSVKNDISTNDNRKRYVEVFNTIGKHYNFAENELLHFSHKNREKNDQYVLGEPIPKNVEFNKENDELSEPIKNNNNNNNNNNESEIEDVKITQKSTPATIKSPKNNKIPKSPIVEKNDDSKTLSETQTETQTENKEENKEIVKDVANDVLNDVVNNKIDNNNNNNNKRVGDDVIYDVIKNVATQTNFKKVKKIIKNTPKEKLINTAGLENVFNKILANNNNRVSIKPNGNIKFKQIKHDFNIDDLIKIIKNYIKNSTGFETRELSETTINKIVELILDALGLNTKKQDEIKQNEIKPIEQKNKIKLIDKINNKFHLN